jgi:hypothetical protein
MTTRKLAALASAAFAALALAAPAGAGNDTSTFATQYNGCLGGLRSAIARGDLAGHITPYGLVVPDGFNGAFNPGDHRGTVLEQWFLTQVAGFPQATLAALCARSSRRKAWHCD